MYKNSCARARCGATCSTPEIEPVGMETTVAAGMACVTPCTDICMEPGTCGAAVLAQLMFPIQEYTYGFCPSDALAKGTLFPELVR